MATSIPLEIHEPVAEPLVVMQTEDGFVTLERKDRSTLIVPLSEFPNPMPYHEGAVISAKIYSEYHIEILGIDTDSAKIAMSASKHRPGRSRQLHNRAKRSTNLGSTK